MKPFTSEAHQEFCNTGTALFSYTIRQWGDPVESGTIYFEKGNGDGAKTYARVYAIFDQACWYTTHRASKKMYIDWEVMTNLIGAAEGIVRLIELEWENDERTWGDPT